MRVWSIAAWVVPSLPISRGVIFTIFVEVCLDKKEGILGGEGDVYCLPSGSHQGEGVETVKLVYVAKSLRMGGDSIKSVCPAHLADRYS